MLRIVALALAFSLPASPAAAVIYAFSGTLTTVPSGGPLVAGGQFFGDFVVDETSPNGGTDQDGSFALQDFYTYLDSAVLNVTESVNSGFVRVGIGVDTPDGIADVFTAEDQVGNFTYFDDQGLAGLPSDYVFRLSLVRLGGGLFTSPATVPTNLMLADFDFGTLVIGPDGGAPVITGTIRAFEPSSIALVPEPSSWLLLVAGFGTIGFVQRRRPAPACPG